MPPEMPGRAFPRDPTEPEAPGPTPTFRGGVEQVDEHTTGSHPVPPANPSRDERSTGSPAAPPGQPDDDRSDAGHAVPARGRQRRPRARRVQRIVRHIDPWSVLKLSLLFFSALFLIVCVASALLWSAARSSGAIENVESFVTSVGGFGNCEPIDGSEGPSTTTIAPGSTTTLPVDQLDPAGGDSGEVVDEPDDEVAPGDDEDCPDGEELVGEFRFEDGRIFQAFALAGIVLVLAGAATAVVLVLLFNLMSDVTGGVRMTVLQEEPPQRARPAQRAGSPPPRPRE